MRLSRCLVPLDVVALLVGVTACAPSIAPTAKPSGSAIAAEEKTDVPRIRIPTTCAQLADTSVIESWFETSAHVRTDESAPLAGVNDIAFREAGALTCWWSAATSGFDGSRVSFTLLPDAEGAFRQQQNDEVANPYLAKNTAGDASSYSCSSYGDNWSCGASMLVGSVWADVWIMVDTSSPLDEAVASQRMQSLLVRMAAVLRNAQPDVPPWVAPAGAFDGAVLCDPEIAGPWLQGIGLTAPAGSGSDFGYQQAFVHEFAQLTECAWYDGADEGGSAVQLATVTIPGGAWVFADGVPLSATWGSVALTEEVDIDGLDAARLGCDGGGCSAFVSLGGSAVSISGYGLTREQFVAVLSAMPS